MKTTLCTILAIWAIASPALADNATCISEYGRGERETGAWAEMLGIVEGTIYGHSLTLPKTRFCLAGSPKEQVQAIAKAFGTKSFEENPILMDDVPTKEQAEEFLVRFFPCH